MRELSAYLLALVLCAAPLFAVRPESASAPSTGGERGQADASEDVTGEELKERYDTALRHYGSGDYSKAILQYTEILKLDPRQKRADEMIRRARERIAQRDKELALFGHVRAGEYQKALVALQPLLDGDPGHPLYKRLQERLEDVIEVCGPKAPEGRAWRAAKKGLAGLLGAEEDLQLAYDALRHARDIEPDEARFARFIKLALEVKPGLAQDKITPGMTLLEYLRAVALEHIYDGKYHLAVRVLTRALAFEPDDLVCLKRLGSAYYALKRCAKAAEAWDKALQSAPADAKMKEFLERARRCAQEPR
ncbi:MAG: hypothetical protein ABII00_19290 [Elusimicrobiota bacterium]